MEETLKAIAGRGRREPVEIALEKKGKDLPRENDSSAHPKEMG